MGFNTFPPTSGGIPGGDTGARPAAPVVGDTYYNGETAGLEIYTGSSWVPSSREWATDNYPPASPAIGTATTSGATTDVAVTWTLNGDGGKPLTSISVTPFLNGTTAQTSVTAATTSSTSATITGLTSGSSYTFKVKATNVNGDSLDSAPSNSITVTTLVTVNYLVIAGGGPGGGRSGTNGGGGGGAGGYRTSAGTTGGGGSAENALSIGIGSNFTVTVGAGGAGVVNSEGLQGSNSVFSNITSTGGALGGGGGGFGGTGGSGGGNSGISGTGGGRNNSIIQGLRAVAQ
jgi:hypothetical protein